MATITSFTTQCKNKEADYIIGPLKRFNWTHFKFKYGYKHYIIHPIQNVPDKHWWTWKNTMNTICCRSCWEKEHTTSSTTTDTALINPIGMPMIVCSVCGNKRCPKATNHINPCTNSNKPGQPGSIYK